MALKIGLHWFRHDLRIHDNEALKRLIDECDAVFGLFAFEPDWIEHNQWGLKHLGQHRRVFLEQALLDLKQSMQDLGTELFVIEGEPLKFIEALAKAGEVHSLSFEHHHGVNEAKAADAVCKIASQNGLSVIEGFSNYLYAEDDFPFSLENMPDTFSPFRRKVEKYAEPRQALDAPNKTRTADVDLETFIADAPELRCKTMNIEAQANDALSEYTGHDSLGGESAAHARIEDYFFSTDGIAEYKETRNGLDGWDFSSRLSAFLAHGCVSPSFVLKRLKSYEAQRVANDSTYWLFFELLWREFFHWQQKKHGARFFAFDGIQGKSPDTHFDPEAFESWCLGKTGYEIVDACMRQLNETGFMSNRGRQLVASCYVHELGLDWRYAAAYFEQQLTDFDVASNWGNWQYLAGVGSDPRGHRQFNLEKQTDTYDPKRKFINKWLDAEAG